jgi:murein DD-endopeptidase MepM/ murein hydrolase activator NlpD
LKIVFRTRYPLHIERILALLLLLALGGIYYYQTHSPKIASPKNVAYLTIAPLVPEIPQAQQQKPPAAPVTNSVEIRKNQTFGDLMQEQGFDAATIQEILEASHDIYNLGQVRAGKSIEITTSTEGTFSELKYEIDPFRTLEITNTDNGITVNMIQHSTDIQVASLGGFIDGSLYNTIDRLGEADELVVRFADIFEWDVDFFKDLQPGDSFRILYEKKFVEGKAYGYGRILAAELDTKGKLYKAIGFQRGQNWEFFSPDGKAMKKAFLASPLKFSRITSGFTSHRFHPILGYYRPHYGIDYAAPTGTPVRSIGRGTVILAGWAGGAGKAIKIQHNKEISTVYSHLSRFASGIRSGASVSQGQIIGYVGMTGLATGPHLDFRYLKKGQYVNFLTIKKSLQDDPLASRELARFEETAPDIAQKLAAIPLQNPASGLAYASPSSPPLNEGNR